MWLPTYALALFLVHWSLRRCRFAFVAFAALAQLADATGEWAWQRTTTQPGHLLVLEPWRELLAAHRAVTVLPAYSCAPDYLLDSIAIEIQFLASGRALPINGTYSARPYRRCVDESRAWPSLVAEPGTLYVVLPTAEVPLAACVAFDHGRLCSTDRAALDAAVRAGIAR